MPIYSCDRCQKTFTKKFNYDVHVNRKFPCEEIIPVKVKVFKCLYCETKYTRKFNLNKHMKTHKEEIEKDKIFDKMLDEMEEMKKKIQEMEEMKGKVQEIEQFKSGQTTIQNTNNVQNNNNRLNNLNLKLAPFEKEYLNFIQKQGNYMEINYNG
jgi:hypothetical protein